MRRVVAGIALAVLAAGCHGDGDDDDESRTPGGGVALDILGYDDPSPVYVAGEPFEPNAPVFEGVATSWSIDPPLPLGLTIDPATGVLSGVAQAASAPAFHVVTAANATESDTFELDVEVEPAVLQTVLISRATDGPAGNDVSLDPAVSDDGASVVFTSVATNLVLGDVNGLMDVFLHEPDTVTTSAITAPLGTLSDDHVERADIAGSAPVVAFESAAGGLVAGGDANGLVDIYVHDYDRATIERVSLGLGGAETDGASREVRLDGLGRRVAFESTASNLVGTEAGFLDADVFVHDRSTGITEAVSVTPSGDFGGDASSFPAISQDGEAVAFYSHATDLVAGDANGQPDVFVRQLATGTTQIVSVNAAGEAGDLASGFDRTALSADGRFVAFVSFATNLVDGDTNGEPDVFVSDRFDGSIERVSVSTGGGQHDGTVGAPDISADGRYVVFTATAALAPGDDDRIQDVYRHDRLTGETRRMSLGPNGEPSLQSVVHPAIAGDGSLTLFAASFPDAALGTGSEYQVWARAPLNLTTELPPTRPALAVVPATDVFLVTSAERVAFDTTRRLAHRAAPGTAPVAWRARTPDGAAWVRALPAAGALEPGEDELLVLRFHTAGLLPGPAQTELVLEDASSGAELVRLRILLRVLP